MPYDNNYPVGVTTSMIPGWEGTDPEKCRDEIAGTRECRNRCEPYQVRECCRERHLDKKCVDNCPICEQDRLAAEYEEEDRKECQR